MKNAATDVMIELYRDMMTTHEGKINPLKDVHEMQQLACMRTEFSLKTYNALKPLPSADQRYVLEILSKVSL